MAGYHGYSMSNNAAIAYGNSEKPLSKWTKGEIIRTLQESAAAPDILQAAKATPAKALRDVCLICTGWHHTSEYFNKTDFYAVKPVEEITAEEILEAGAVFKSKQEPSPKVAPAFRPCEYLVWSGTRSHPKATAIRETCRIEGNWAFTAENGKKSIHAKGFKFLDE